MKLRIMKEKSLKGYAPPKTIGVSPEGRQPSRVSKPLETTQARIDSQVLLKRQNGSSEESVGWNELSQA